MTTRCRSIWPFAALMLALSLVVLAFEWRYMWFLSASEAWMLRGGLLSGLLAIVGLWIWYPSRVLIALVGAAVLLFPQLLEAHRSRSSLGYWLLVLCCILLLVATTAMRHSRRSR